MLVNSHHLTDKKQIKPDFTLGCRDVPPSMDQIRLPGLVRPHVDDNAILGALVWLVPAVDLSAGLVPLVLLSGAGAVVEQ